MRSLFLALILTGTGAPALGQDCTVPPGWSEPARHAAHRLPRFNPMLEVDGAHQLQLLVQRSVILATKEGRPGWMNRFGGLAAVETDRPGKLDIWLSSRARVDLVRDGETLPAVERSRSGCTGIYEMLTFDVQPGRYLLQITDSQAPALRLAMQLR